MVAEYVRYSAYHTLTLPFILLSQPTAELCEYLLHYVNEFNSTY